MRGWPQGFFDINKVPREAGLALMEEGWVPVHGDPNRVVNWRPRLSDRLWAFLSKTVAWPKWWG